MNEQDLQSLSERVLNSLTAHKKMSVQGIFQLFKFPETWDVIDQLVRDGWAKRYDSKTTGIPIDTLERTSKQKWKQPSLF